MPRHATKAMGNRYYDARMKAAKYHKMLLTRAGAAECLPGITEDNLKRYELGIITPPKDVVALMAEVYNEPELRSWYCANECPLGNDCREIPDITAERALIRLQNTIPEIEQITKELLQLMDSCSLEEVDSGIIHNLRQRLLECRRRVDENLIILEKAEKHGTCFRVETK